MLEYGVIEMSGPGGLVHSIAHFYMITITLQTFPSAITTVIRDVRQHGQVLSTELMQRGGDTLLQLYTTSQYRSTR